MLLLMILGVAAGLITTLTGFGGGLFLVTVLALLWDPITALTMSSVALLVGNAQRLFLFRPHIDTSLAKPVILGCMPGALGGALIATATPEWVLQVAIVLATVGALLRVVVNPNWTVPVSWILPGSALVGFLAATTGGGGFLLAPLLLSAGVTGGRYIATGCQPTSSACATGAMLTSDFVRGLPVCLMPID